MKRLWLCVSVLVCAIAVAPAAEKPEKATQRKQSSRILARNVRLDFKAVPLEEGDSGVYIITAAREYSTAVRLQGEEGELEFEVSGEVELLDDGRIFVRLQARALLNGDGEEAEFNVFSGVILKPGQELGVSRMGDKTLMIRASYVDSKPTSDDE